MRFTVRLIGAIALLSVLAALMVYGFAMRTGRYQIERLDNTMYAVLDTATGAVWVYRAHLGRTRDGEPKFEFREEDVSHGPELLWRLKP